MSETAIIRGDNKESLDLIQVVDNNPYLITRELNNRSLFHFMKVFWDQVATDAFVPNWHISYLCYELEKVAKRVVEGKPKLYDLIINVPPGTTKTITCSIMFPVWCWTQWPKLRFITASYGERLSLETAEYARDLIRSDIFKAIYPDIEIREDKDTKGNYKITQKVRFEGTNRYQVVPGGNRYSTSVGGTLTGFHGHILIIDDPINPEQAASEKELEKANRWMTGTLSTRKINKAVTPTILIMQRLHQDDPTGNILTREQKNLRHICLPGEIRNYKSKLKPPELEKYYRDDLLDPRRMPWSVLDEMQSVMGQYGYAGQVGQDPSPPGGGMFKVDQVAVLDDIPHPGSIMKKIRYWDKAGTEEGQKGAYTCGVHMFQLTSGRWFIADVRRGKWSTEVRERVIRQTAEIDGLDTHVYVEQEPGSGGKESAQGTIMNLVGYACYADRPTGDKIFRADPYSVQMNSGRLQMLKADWNFTFLDEHRLFPFSTYKDQVDAAAGAFNKLVMKKTVRRIT